MVITTSKDVTKQGFCKGSEENSVFGRVSYYLLLEFLWEGVGWGGCLFEAGRLLTFSAFRMGANSRLGAYLNKYSILVFQLITDYLYNFF